jgi:hypothetical protein
VAVAAPLAHASRVRTRRARPRPGASHPAVLRRLQTTLGNQGLGGLLRRAEAAQSAEAARCRPAPGLPTSVCDAYARNSWWLPNAYVQNATHACTETPNVPTANCVRGFLQDRLAATPASAKTAAAAEKPKEQRALTYPSYVAFVQGKLTPRIYRDHVDAYGKCCCPSGPAAYPAWVGVTTVPLPRTAVGTAIRLFGSCHGTPGWW